MADKKIIPGGGLKPSVVPGIKAVPVGKPPAPKPPTHHDPKPPAPRPTPGIKPPAPNYYYSDYASDETVKVNLRKYCAVELLNALIFSPATVPPLGKKGKGKGAKGGGGGGGYGGTPPTPGKKPPVPDRPPAPGRKP
jgi:hypothetical protein